MAKVKQRIEVKDWLAARDIVVKMLPELDPDESHVWLIDVSGKKNQERVLDDYGTLRHLFGSDVVDN